MCLNEIFLPVSLQKIYVKILRNLLSLFVEFPSVLLYQVLSSIVFILYPKTSAIRFHYIWILSDLLQYCDILAVL